MGGVALWQDGESFGSDGGGGRDEGGVAMWEDGASFGSQGSDGGRRGMHEAPRRELLATAPTALWEDGRDPHLSTNSYGRDPLQRDGNDSHLSTNSRHRRAATAPSEGGSLSSQRVVVTSPQR